MKFKIKKLNDNEKYACSSKAIKSIFKDTDVYINFGGFSRKFNFNSKDTKRPKIKGTVILSAGINIRDYVSEEFYNDANISFYVINDVNYSEEDERTFIGTYLPMLFKWYKSIMERPETALSGIENFLIEWDNGEFKTHCYRYA